MLKTLTRRGHRVTVQDGKIAVDPGIGPEDTAALRAAKPEILEAFARQEHAIAALSKHGFCPVTACIDSPWGLVWIVPARTGLRRFEVTWQDIAEDPQGVLERCRTVLLAMTMMEGVTCS